MQQDKHFHCSKQIWGGLTITVLLSMHMRDTGSKCILSFNFKCFVVNTFLLLEAPLFYEV